LNIAGRSGIKIAGTTGLITLFKAFAAQALGLALTLALAWMSPALCHGAWRLALLQGVAAALWSKVLRQRYWWLPIHLLFLPTAIAMLSLQLPSWLYLLTVLLLALVFWGTVKGDVPLFLSSSAVADALASIVERENAGVFADLGAGVGSVAVPLAQRRAMIVGATSSHDRRCLGTCAATVAHYCLALPKTAECDCETRQFMGLRPSAL